MNPIAHRTRSRTGSQYPLSHFVSYANLSPNMFSFVSSISSVSVPRTVQEALDHSGWTHAMIEEMEALHANQTWDLVSLPPGKQVVGCRWVFVIKYHADGTVERLKARLVAKGYTQTYGIDYDETFSPVAKIPSVRVLISLASRFRWTLHQLDVKNAFLHGDLQEEVYMEQPPGFVAQGEKMCKLRKALYGLKQSPRAWFGRFSDAVVSFGMRRCSVDHSVFSMSSKAGCVILLVYVDDIILLEVMVMAYNDSNNSYNKNSTQKIWVGFATFLELRLLTLMLALLSLKGSTRLIYWQMLDFKIANL